MQGVSGQARTQAELDGGMRTNHNMSANTEATARFATGGDVK